MIYIKFNADVIEMQSWQQNCYINHRHAIPCNSMQNVNRRVETNVSIEVNVSKMYVYESMRIVSSSRYKLDDKIGKTIVVHEWDPILYFKNLWNNKQQFEDVVPIIFKLMAGELSYNCRWRFTMMLTIWLDQHIKCWGLIQKSGAYVWKVHREIYDILVKTLSIMMMNGLIYYWIVEITC